MKTKTYWSTLVIVAIFLSSCVPEDQSDQGKHGICNAAGVISNSIVLTLFSQNPLPKNLKVAFNDSDEMYADECDPSNTSSTKNTKLSFDPDRKKAIIVFNLGDNQDLYNQYFSGERELINEYFDAQIYSRTNCSTPHSLEQEKLNILITEKNVSEAANCPKDYTQAFGQFTFQPL